MARLRMEGVIADSEIPTPASGTATIFYNSTDRIYKVKLDDGSVAPIGSGSGGGTWGSITGILSAQTDLQDALDAKYDASNPASFVDAAGAASAAPVQSVAGKTGTVTLASSDVGLGNVDNTSDANKPVSTATQLALNDKYDASNPDNFVDATGAAAAAPVQSVAGKTGTVTLSSADVGLGNVDNTSDANKPISTATQLALNDKYDSSNPANYVDATGAANAAPVQSVAGKTGTVTLSSADVGLGNVDNTSDANKPISTATQLALNDKYDSSNPANYVDATGAAAAAPVQSVAGKTGAVTIDLSTDVTGALPVSLGGSGRTDFPALQLLFGAPDSLSIDRSEFFTYDASIGLFLNVGGQMQTRSLEQNPTDPSAVVIYDKVEVTGDDGTGPAYTRIKRDYLEAKKVLPTKELSASVGFDGTDSWLGISETTNAGNNISMAKIFPNKAQLFTVDIGLGNGPQPILPVDPIDLTTKAYVDSANTTLQNNIDDLTVYAQDIRSDVDDLTVYAQDIRTDLDQFVAPSGVTRPASPVVGQIFFDTNLGKPIFYNGSAWIDAAGTVV